MFVFLRCLWVFVQHRTKEGNPTFNVKKGFTEETDILGRNTEGEQEKVQFRGGFSD